MLSPEEVYARDFANRANLALVKSSSRGNSPIQIVRPYHNDSEPVEEKLDLDFSRSRATEIILASRR